MTADKLIKQIATIAIVISITILNSNTFLLAETITNTNNLTEVQTVFVENNTTESLTSENPSSETDEILLEIEDIINNVSTLTNEDIINRLNTILDKLVLKTPEERSGYTQKLSQAIRDGIGKVSILPQDKYVMDSYYYYTLSVSSVTEKAEELKILVENYKKKLEVLGYNNLIYDLEVSRAVTLDYYEDMYRRVYVLQTDMNTIEELTSRNVGIRTIINKNIAIISSEALTSFYNSENDNKGKIIIEMLHDNYMYPGKTSNISTQINDNYMDLKTYGYHVGVSLKYENLNMNSTVQNIIEFNGPVFYVLNYSRYKDYIKFSRLWSYDFREYELNENIYLNNFYKDGNTSQVYISSIYPGPHAIGTYDRTFEDIKTHWARENVEELASRFIVKGKTYQNFEPDSNITRAEYASLLTRVLGIESENYSGGFKDVSANEWYANNVQAAAKYGLINGYDGYFRPNDYITREEMTSILMRAYSLVYNENVTGSVDIFSDKGDISSWALDNVSGAVEKGFIKGVTQNTFKPRATATRAESATILLRFINYLEVN